MTINERLALMDEITRKNNREWGMYKSKPRAQLSLTPAAEFTAKCVITFCAVILLGIVALIAA